MSGRVRKIVKRWIQMATAACLMLAVAFDVCAVETPTILEEFVTEDTAYLYLRHSGESQSAEVKIGTEPSWTAELTGIDSIPVVTWLLVDNSVSISKADQARIKSLLVDLVAGKAPGERFNLCTYSEKMNVLVQNSQDYAELKGKIDEIQHINQKSYLTDVLDELLDVEEQREEPTYVRVVVFCDGVDNNPGGLTREELNKRLSEHNIPIYTFGCTRKGNEPLLKELYALSRQTGAQSWTLSELKDTLEPIRTIGGTELPVCAEIQIPEKLRDGSEKGIQLTLDGGATASVQVTMPFGDLPEEKPEEKPQEKPPAEPEPVAPSEPEPTWNPLLLIIPLAVVILAAIGVTVFLLLRRGRKPLIDPVNPHGGEGYPEGITEIPDDDDSSDGNTIPLVDNDVQLTLCLTDCADPGRHFEVPLRSRVSIGRNTTNQIVVDYERSVSGRHCEIFVDGKKFKLRDLNSSNGTIVDGIRVVDVAEISNGSVIRLGRVEFRVKIR